MKKLLLVSGILMSLALTASAQEKKAAVQPATTTTSTVTVHKKTIAQVRQEKNARKVALVNAKKNHTQKVDTRTKETLSNSN